MIFLDFFFAACIMTLSAATKLNYIAGSEWICGISIMSHADAVRAVYIEWL
jgi:uncharacterized membrane protein